MENYVTNEPLTAKDVSFTIPGMPVSQWRFRVAADYRVSAPETREISGFHVYDGQKDKKYFWQKSLRSVLPPGHSPLRGPLCISSVFYLPLPRKHLARAASERLFHLKDPEIISLVKWTEDCCNLIAWHDDRQVVERYDRKEYCLPGNERTEIYVHEIETHDPWLYPHFASLRGRSDTAKPNLLLNIPGFPVPEWRHEIGAEYEEIPNKHGSISQKRISGFHVYSQQKAMKHRWQRLVRERIPTGHMPFRGPVFIAAIFYVPMPPELLDRNERVFLMREPDETNYIKWVEDCLDGIAWEKAAQVVEHYDRKEFCRPGQERTELFICQLGVNSEWLFQHDSSLSFRYDRNTFR